MSTERSNKAGHARIGCLDHIERFTGQRRESRRRGRLRKAADAMRASQDHLLLENRAPLSRNSRYSRRVLLIDKLSGKFTFVI